MNEEKKEEQEQGMTPVEKEGTIGENPVDDTMDSVEEMGTEPIKKEESAENVENSVEDGTQGVENVVEVVDAPVETETEKAEAVDESVDNVDNSEEFVGKTVENPKKSGTILKILLGFAAFVALLAFCWYSLGGGLGKAADVGVLYAKENNLYLYDLQNEPYLVQEGVSNGGQMHSYYSAWGAKLSDKGEALYYLAEVDENGIGNLYYKDAKNKDATPVLVAEDVFDFGDNEDGSKAVYLKYEKDQATLYLYMNGESTLVSDGILMEQGSYGLENDGAFLLYQRVEDGRAVLYAMEAEAGAEAVKLSDSVALYTVAEETDILYYVAQNEAGDHALYSYTMGAEPQVVAEGVSSVEVLPNGRDVLYAIPAGEKTLYSDIIEDDVTDLTQYDAEKQGALTEVKDALAAGEGIEPLLQDCYLLTESGTVKIEKQVIFAGSIQGNTDYFVGYAPAEPIKAKLSEMNGLEDALYAYYMALAYGEKETFLVNLQGEAFVLKGTGIDAASVRVAADGKTVAYKGIDTTTGVGVVMTEVLGSDAEPVTVAENVEFMAFLGETDTLGYLNNYQEGLGDVGLAKQAAGEELDSSVTGVTFAEDRETVYYLADLDMMTGKGTLLAHDGKEGKLLDTEIFAFQYKGNGKLVYMKNYDIITGLGDLYYYDNGKPRLLDTGVTAIYMY